MGSREHMDFRPTVVLTLVNGAGHSLLLESAKARALGEVAWSPIQGGIEPGESVLDAAIREAHEEVGIPREDLLFGFHAAVAEVRAKPQRKTRSGFRLGKLLVAVPAFYSGNGQLDLDDSEVAAAKFVAKDDEARMLANSSLEKLRPVRWSLAFARRMFV